MDFDIFIMYFLNFFCSIIKGQRKNTFKQEMRTQKYGNWANFLKDSLSYSIKNFIINITVI